VLSCKFVNLGISISLMNCKLTDFSALSLKLLLFMHLSITKSYSIDNEVNKCNPEESVSLWGSKPYAHNQQSIFFIRAAASNQHFVTSEVT